MNRFPLRNSKSFGWPFYITRKTLRGVGRWCQRTADALAQRERYPDPFFTRQLVPENAVLKDRHSGGRCFVIGNGPSLNHQDISPLASEITLAMNGFFRHPFILRAQPTYYLFADGVFFDGSRPSTNFLSDLHASVRASTFIAPYAFARTVQRGALLPLARTHFVAFAGNLRSSRLTSVDLTRSIPSVNNCAQLAILCALYMGCREILLLGMDHDWLAHRGPETHFYAQKTLQNHAVAHGDRWPYMELMTNAMELWQGYEALRVYAQRTGVRIANCTPGGFLDVFERQRLEEVLGARPPLSKAA